jgi:hypothetical protein
MTMTAGANVVHVEEATLNSSYTNFGKDGQFLTFDVTALGANRASGVTIIAVFGCGDAGGRRGRASGTI